MIKSSLERLRHLCVMLPPLLLDMKDEEFSFKSSPAKWSKKQIIGHLVDSAANNHQRFVRVQFEETPTIVYDQNKWNSHSYYQDMDSKTLIHFWAAYNGHLANLATN